MIVLGFIYRGISYCDIAILYNIYLPGGVVKRLEGGALAYTEVRSADVSTCRLRYTVVLEYAD